MGDARRLLRRILPARAIASLRRLVLRRTSELPVVEVLAARHCNLSCKGCNAFAPLSEPRFEDPDVFDRDIRRLAQLFDRITRIGIVGGEPLLHPHITRFMRSARAASPGSEIYLVSNGILVPSQPDSFWREMAANRIKLNISAYPVPIDRAAIVERAARYGVEVEFVGPRDEFWNFPIRPEGTCDAAHSFEVCRQATNCPMVSDGTLYRCGRVGVSEAFCRASGIDLPALAEDRVDIYGDVDAFEIQELLSRPLDWCRYCDVDAVKTFPWESGKRTADEWL